MLKNAKGYLNQKTIWRFQIVRRENLLQFIDLIKPYVRHAKRRGDMLAVEDHLKKAGER